MGGITSVITYVQTNMYSSMSSRAAQNKYAWK